jgi:very-short-patch-repair endonuclease
LRIINVGSLRTEHLIDFFVVDILINNSYVVEVNGSTHYNYNMETMKKEYNKKTSFRSKVLRKLGYYLIEVNL